MTDNKRKRPPDLIPIILAIIIISLLLAALFYPIDEPSEGYEYTGIDCFLRFNVTRSLSNLTEIVERHGFTYEERYSRTSPGNQNEITDYIYFSYHHSTQKNISGYIYNFDSDNISIKLHYYPNDIMSYVDKTAEEVRNLTYSIYLIDKNRFENDVENIIQIFEPEFNITVSSEVYVQLVEHFIII
ncbi:MAG: hypothetical protein JSV09_04070 [Thermoplasmata archaeon]|nr:MAG: hypothetical protein JSV09_04070 [Thermoplasmata archaeon]